MFKGWDVDGGPRTSMGSIDQKREGPSSPEELAAVVSECLYMRNFPRNIRKQTGIPPSTGGAGAGRV